MTRANAVVTMSFVTLWAGMAAGMATVATAQTTANQPASTQPAAPVAGRAPLGVTVIQLEEVVVGWSAKKALLGKAVVNDKNERIGKIDDLIITPSTDAKGPFASFAIIGVGGFLGIGTKDVAIPSEQFKLQNGKLTLPGATKDALKTLPEFKYAKR